MGSILLASQGQLTLACWLVFAGAAFDVLDGLAARALGGGSALGAQLDSLADMVTFGVAPGVLLYQLLSNSFSWYWSIEALDPMIIVSIAALLIPIASAWRLAKFNIDTRQTEAFLGLPTPANALFWAGVVLVHANLASRGSGEDWSLWMLFWHPFVLILCAFILCVLMLSSIPLPSLKIKHFRWKGNEVIFLLLGIGATLVIIYDVLAVPMILLLYLLSPLWGKPFSKTQ